MITGRTQHLVRWLASRNLIVSDTDARHPQHLDEPLQMGIAGGGRQCQMKLTVRGATGIRVVSHLSLPRYRVAHPTDHRRVTSIRGKPRRPRLDYRSRCPHLTSVSEIKVRDSRFPVRREHNQALGGQSPQRLPQWRP